MDKFKHSNKAISILPSIDLTTKNKKNKIKTDNNIYSLNDKHFKELKEFNEFRLTKERQFLFGLSNKNGKNSVIDFNEEEGKEKKLNNNPFYDEIHKKFLEANQKFERGRKRKSFSAVNQNLLKQQETKIKKKKFSENFFEFKEGNVDSQLKFDIILEKNESPLNFKIEDYDVDESLSKNKKKKVRKKKITKSKSINNMNRYIDLKQIYRDVKTSSSESDSNSLKKRRNKKNSNLKNSILKSYIIKNNKKQQAKSNSNNILSILKNDDNPKINKPPSEKYLLTENNTNIKHEDIKELNLPIILPSNESTNKNNLLIPKAIHIPKLDLKQKKETKYIHNVFLLVLFYLYILLLILILNLFILKTEMNIDDNEEEMNQNELYDKDGEEYNDQDGDEDLEPGENSNEKSNFKQNYNNIEELNISDDDESDEEKNKTFKQKLDIYLSENNFKQILEFITCSLSAVTFCIYIASTYYNSETFIWFNYFDYICCFIFYIEILINIYLAQHRWHYFLRINNFIDLFTTSVPYLYSINTFYISKLIELARIFRILKVNRYMAKNMKNNENEVAKQITIMIQSVISMIMIFALVFRIAEIEQINQYIMNADVANTGLSNQYHFHDFLYFIVVTLFTVGYGDIYPLTEIGRLVIVLLISISVFLIPKQTNELIKLMSTSSVYARATYESNPEAPHLVICGNVGVDALKNFCYELFHPDHGTQDKNAVIIQNSLPGQEMKVFLHAGIYEVSLKYLQGNPIFEKDLARADILNSKAAVIMTDKYSGDPHLVDHQNILLSLAIKKYFLYNKKESQLFIQLIKPENKIHYQSGLLSKSHFNNDQVIIVEEIKMNLLSKSCLIPGIITMTSNLVMSAGSQNEDIDSIWIEEYTEGRGHEIYRTLLNDSFKNRTFSKLSSEIYSEYEAIVFALEIEVEGKTIIRLNPANFFIEKLVNDRDDVKIYIYIICSDKAVADRIETAEGRNEKVDDVVVDNSNKKALSKFERYMKLGIQDTMQIDENIDPGNELAEEEDEYFIIKDNVNNNVDVKKDSIRNHEVYNKHIVVCGTHPSLYYFILPLRAKYLGVENLKYVVILAENMPKDLWDSISRFEKIILINGSPLNIEDLYRANIEYADKAVILECETSKYSKNDSHMIDWESVFIYKAIKKCNQNIQIMTELVYDSNIEFLLPKKELSNLLKNNNRITYETTSLFAAGEVYISSIIDTLTCQAYYNPHIVTIIHQLLTGGKNTSNFTMRGICENVGLKSSNLWQMPIPEKFINKTFSDLFTELAEQENLIALGLYRLAGARDNDHPYVYTNPKPTTRLTHRDRIFLLAIGDINKYIKKLNFFEKNEIDEHTHFDKRSASNKMENQITNMIGDPNRGNKITPFREMEDAVTEIESYVRSLESLYESMRNSLQESISNAVKQEFSALLH